MFTPVPCPNCRQAVGNPVKFSWWGGMLGPKMFSHVRCPACGHEYNGKTGQSNSTAIAIYLAVSVVIGLALGLYLYTNILHNR